MTKKWYSKKFRGRAALTCAAVLALTSSFGLLAGCSEDETDTSTTSSNPDSQVIKNGNFEFYDDNDGIYLISSPNNWSNSALGTSSYVMSGVINTKSSKWATLTDSALIETLDANNELADNYDDDPDTYEDDYEDNYVDYNGMHSYDIPYVDVGSAIEDYLDADDDEKDETAIETIANPGTRYNVWQDTATSYYYYTNDDGEDIRLYTREVSSDDEGYYYLDEDEEKVYLSVDDSGDYINDYFLDEDCTEEFETSVLMVHNYLKNGNGTGQYYGSSTSVTLEANTAAEITVWVKTSDLYYDNYTAVTQNRGAFIEVDQTVGNSSIDSFSIEYINTEKLNANGDFDDTNGWVQYTIYIQACDYAETTVTISLGLGADGAGAVEGYAFFDDVVCTKYSSIGETSLYDSVESGYIEATNNGDGTYTFSTKADSTDGTTCTLLSEGSEKVFEADSATYNSQTTTYNDPRYSEKFYYYIDLTASGSRGTITLTDGSNITTAPTLDDDDYYVSDYTNTANYGLTVTTRASSTTYQNAKLSSIKTDNDILALLKITDSASILSALSGSSYASLMSEQLAGAASLPQATDDTQTVLILSAMGAPYTATVKSESGSNFTIGAGEYYIISIWVKTSDMSGATAATINLVDVDDEDNTATLTIDTTGTTTDITDNNGDTTEDIYDGWVQCFFYIQNDTEEDKDYYLELKFGESTIKGTAVSAYSGGWAAFTNITTLEINETEFGYASSGDNTATLTFSVEDNRSSNYFDTASSSSDIESDLTKATNYTGVNGASATIVSNEDDISPYDYTNNNAYAGLLNIDYLQTYLDNDLSWAKALITVDTNTAEALTQLQQIFGNSVQPLLIANTIRTYADNKTTEVTEDNYYLYYTYDPDTQTYTKATSYDSSETYYSLKQVLNYGYIGSDTTLSSETYTAISVKVKVSGSTSAFVYLTSSDSEVLSYETPEYTFWYDTDGNVLKEAPDEDDDDYDAEANIAYKIRTDGLYEDEDGNLYANLYTLTKIYYDENADYYDEDGNLVSYDDLKEDGVYYIDKEKTAYSPHRLVTSESKRVFEYSGEGVGTEAVYWYYISYEEDDETYYYYDTDYKVKTFDTSVATPRYTASTAGDMTYCFEISDTNGEWATVNFLVYTGSESKTYRLELWSGERDSTGVSVDIGDTFDASDGYYKTTDSSGESLGYVIFDYSYLSLDETTYAALLEEYTDNIIEQYQKILISSGITVKSNDENLDYYKQLVADNSDKISNADKATLEQLEEKYSAYYYTFTLYDSTAYYPFNEETAGDDDTGYDYTIDDFEETLAFFRYTDEDTNTYTMFIDYSAVDQSIDRVETSDEDEEDEDEESDTNIWLLASSIVLVIALILTLIAMIVRDLARKVSRKRNSKRLAKNVYTKRKRYIRQYTKANGEIDVNGAGGEPNPETSGDAEQNADGNGGNDSNDSNE